MMNKSKREIKFGRRGLLIQRTKMTLGMIFMTGMIVTYLIGRRLSVMRMIVITFGVGKMFAAGRFCTQKNIVQAHTKNILQLPVAGE